MNPDWLLLAVAILSATVALFEYRKRRAREQSKDYLDMAVQQFERAYRALEQSISRDPNFPGLPKPDRLLWLTVARMLKTGQDIGEKIVEPSLRDLFVNARWYWRERLYELLQGLNTAPLHYFAETPDRITGGGMGERHALSDKSLKIVSDFLTWPETELDPLKAVPPFTEAEIGRMQAFQPRGLGNYLEAMNAITNGPQDRREFFRGRWPADQNRDG